MTITVVVLLIQQLRKRMVKHPAHMIVLNPNTHQEHLMTGANLPSLQPMHASIAAKWVTLPRTVQDPSKVGIVYVRSAQRFLKMIRIRMMMKVVRDPPSHQEDGYDSHESYQGGDIEEVEVDMYNNNYYSRTTDDDALAAMTEMPADKVHSGERDIKMWKAVMTVSKESHPRPTFPPNMKECLATFMKVGGQEAWTLCDSGSTMTGITPSFVDVAKITVFPLKNPHVLQLRTVGSRASVNFGAYIDVATHGSLQQKYVDIANFDHYDMIIGTPFMRSRTVVLDFENDTVKIWNQLIPATKVLLPDTDNCVRWYRATEKKQE